MYSTRGGPIVEGCLWIHLKPRGGIKAEELVCVLVLDVEACASPHDEAKMREERASSEPIGFTMWA